MDSSDSLNWSHRLHLLTSFKYVDQLLSDSEAILRSASAKSAFPKYRPDLSPVQIKIVDDYITLIRSQMLQVLKARGISPPAPRVGATHAIRVNLEFADITFDECRPEALRGYGKVSDSIIPEIAGMVEEMRGLVKKLSRYLGDGSEQDLARRLERLEGTTNEAGALKVLEQIISRRGLVEFRMALSIILERLESNSFEIALFGRVSSGKSSLLNSILEQEILPVGVNPITAVPTRIVHGATEQVKVAYLDRPQESCQISRLCDFVSEEGNPGNSKHVTRIVVELPFQRLKAGVVFVDTPGLGSLATSGAAETLAYLPQCDLGVILVDSASTLGAEDISTVKRLQEAGIPAMLLLSKVDLLSAQDRVRSIDYISRQMFAELGLSPPVFPVSTRGEDRHLLQQWFEREIQPMCDRHQEMSRRALRLKIGVLRESIKDALLARLGPAGEGAEKRQEQLDSAESCLLKVVGRFEDVNTWSHRASDEIRSLGEIGLDRAAARIALDSSTRGSFDVDPTRRVVESLEGIATEGARQIADKLQELARDLARALSSAAGALEVPASAFEEDLNRVAKEMPQWDSGPLEVMVRPGAFAFLGKGFLRERIKKKLRKQIGSEVKDSFERYSRMIRFWSQRSLSELRRRFDAYADGYRAQIERLTNLAKTGPEATEDLRRDLEALSDDGREEKISAENLADSGRAVH